MENIGIDLGGMQQTRPVMICPQANHAEGALVGTLSMMLSIIIFRG
jgi:hypothetical protein